MLTRLSIKNASIVFLFTALVIMAGVYTMPLLGIDFLPEIAPPVVSVVTVYPNASPDTVMQDVTKPIEEAISSMPSLQKLRSTSNENVSVVIAEFSYGIDMEKTEGKVTAAINRIKSDLPENIIEPRISRFDLGDAPILSLSVTSKGGNELTSKIVKDIIKPEIESIPGVAQVNVSGLSEKRYEIILNPEKLNEHKLSTSQIVQVLKASNLTMPAGSFDIDSKTIPVQTVGRIKSKADLENFIVSISIDEKKMKELQEKELKDAISSMQSAALQAQQDMLKQTFEIQNQMLSAQVKAMIEAALKNQAKQIPGAGQPSPSVRNPVKQPPAQHPQTPSSGNQKPVTPGTDDKTPLNQPPSNPSEPSTKTPDGDTQLQQQPYSKPSTDTGEDPNSSDKVTRQTILQPQARGYRQAARVMPVSTLGFKSLGSPQSATTMGSPSFNMASSPATSTAESSETPFKIVYLKDVAKVGDAYETGTSIYRTNQRPSIGIDVKKGLRQNTVAISDAIYSKLSDLEQRAGNNTEIIVMQNQADYIKRSINGMIHEGLLGALFAVLVIFIFLRNVRSTLVSAISIPLSVIIGLIFLYIAGISLNLFTLGGITIAIGRVVDDSIVVLENVFRHMQTKKEETLVAVTSGTNEVVRAITVSTITTIAVFLPLAFVEGFIGELFKPFAYTVTLTLLASLLVAVTVVPVLAARFISSKNIGHAKDNTILKRAYLATLEWSLNHRTIVMLLSLVLFIGSVALITQIPKNFISAPNKGSFSVNIEMPVGTSLSRTSEIASNIEKILAEESRIKTFQTHVGSAQGSFASSGTGDTAVINATLKDKFKDEKEKFVKDIRTRIVKIDPEAKIAVSGAEQVAGMNNTIEVIVTAGSYDKLTQANSIILQALSDIKEISNMKSNLSQRKSELWVEVDEVAAMKKGLTAFQVAATVRGAINGETATTIEKDGISTDIFVRLDRDKIRDSATLAALPVVSPMGNSIRLDSIAKIDMTTGPVNITRIDQDRSLVITMEPVVKNTSEASRLVKEAIESLNLPRGTSAYVGGVTAQMDEGFDSMGLALVIAVFLVYIVMVATFKSLLHPLTMLFSLPLAVIGAAGGLFITGRELGMPSLIGLLMLVGIVVTNAIVLIDLVQQLRSRGYPVKEAVIQASATRMRPILMTAITTILALIPMAAGSTEGGIISAPLATVVIGGLLSSTMLTLVIIPVLYISFDNFRDRLGIPDSSVKSPSQAEGASF